MSSLRAGVAELEAQAALAKQTAVALEATKLSP